MKDGAVIQVGIDSQCLSYVIDAFSAIGPPSDALAPQKIALARLFFYLPGTLWVTPTVTAECANIRNTERATLHDSFIAVLFGELPVSEAKEVERRSQDLLKLHSGPNDCRIVAEAEHVGLDVLLTFDSKMAKRLGSNSTVRLSEPLSYWNQLAIPQGARPDKIPHQTNPLAEQTWWRW